jgi:hypothetical protein
VIRRKHTPDVARVFDACSRNADSRKSCRGWSLAVGGKRPSMTSRPPIRTTPRVLMWRCLSTVKSPWPTSKTWAHLQKRDRWHQPAAATDDQVLLMTTCMETWLASDRAALKEHYGAKLKENALPPLVNMESRDRHDIHDALCKATDGCKNKYEKGKRSFEVVAGLTPGELRKHLPSFERIERILKVKL